MQLHNIKPSHKRKKSKRVGRGATRGTYSGHGIKGQKGRSGRKMRPEMRDIIKKIPKKRGYKFLSIKDKPTIVNIAALEVFSDGDTVSPAALAERKIIRRKGLVAPPVKILGTGNINKKLVFSGCIFSDSAKKKIEKAGGKIV